MYDLVEIRTDYEKVMIRKPPKSKSENEDWLVKQIDETHSVYRKDNQLGYKKRCVLSEIREFVRGVAKKQNYKIVRSNYHLAVNELLSRIWIIESKINPNNDSAEFVVSYFEDDKKADFILPDYLSAE